MEIFKSGVDLLQLGVTAMGGGAVLMGKIRDGHIRNVYTLRFGYCCYPAQNEEIILYPVWEIECDYVFDPKQEMRIYPEDDGIPITSGRYYSTMIVNAQTGEFMNPIELKEKLLDCPKIIRWEDVQ